MIKKVIIKKNHLTHLKNEVWVLHTLSELNQYHTKGKIPRNDTRIVN